MYTFKWWERFLQYSLLRRHKWFLVKIQYLSNCLFYIKSQAYRIRQDQSFVQDHTSFSLCVRSLLFHTRLMVSSLKNKELAMHALTLAYLFLSLISDILDIEYSRFHKQSRCTTGDLWSILCRAQEHSHVPYTVCMYELQQELQYDRGLGNRWTVFK